MTHSPDSSTVSPQENKTDTEEKMANSDDLRAQVKPYCSYRKGKEEPFIIGWAGIYYGLRLASEAGKGQRHYEGPTHWNHRQTACLRLQLNWNRKCPSDRY